MNLFLKIVLFIFFVCAPLAKAGKDEHGSNDSLCALALTKEVAHTELQKLIGATTVQNKLESAETLLRLIGQDYRLPKRSLREFFRLSKRHLLFEYGPFWQQRVQFKVDHNDSDKEIKWVAYNPAARENESTYRAATQWFYVALPNLSRSSTIWLTDSDLLRVLEWGVEYSDELPELPLIISVTEQILIYE